MQLCLGVFPIQSWCAEWLQQMAAKVRLVKCANIRKVLAEYLASYADCCGLTLTYMKYARLEQQGLIRGFQNSTTIPFTQGFNDRKR